MGKFKIGQPARHNINKRQDKQLSDLAKDVMEKHSNLFERLAILEAKEKEAIKPCVCPSPSIVEPKTILESVYIRDERPIIDTKARLHSTLLRKDLDNKVNDMDLIAKLSLKQIKDRLDVLESKKPEEKQIVIEKHNTETIVKLPITEKKVWVAIGIAVALNILALIIK